MCGELVGEIVKRRTLGPGAAKAEEVGVLQRDDPKTNRRASRNLRIQPKSAFSRLPHVHRPICEGQQRVESAQSPSG
jgi:hypothetical protein